MKIMITRLEKQDDDIIAAQFNAEGEPGLALLMPLPSDGSKLVALQGSNCVGDWMSGRALELLLCAEDEERREACSELERRATRCARFLGLI